MVSKRFAGSLLFVVFTALFAVALPSLPANAETNVVDWNNWLIGDLEMELATDGNPVVGYSNTTPGRFGFFDTFVKISICHDAACSQVTTRILDEADSDNWDMSMALGATGNPVVGYTATDAALKLSICSDPTCTTQTFRTIDDIGEKPSIEINTAGNPMISYLKNFRLWLAVCDDPTCSTWSQEEIYDDFATSAALELDSNRNAVMVSAHSSSSGAIRLTSCEDVTCTTRTSVVMLDNEFVSGDVVLAFDGVGLASAVFDDFDSRSARIVSCLDHACGATTDSTIDLGDGELVLGDPSISFDATGNPLVLLHDYRNQLFLMARCVDRACSSSSLITIEVGELAGSRSAITLSAHHIPVVMYGFTDGVLKFTTSCGYNFGDVAAGQYYTEPVNWAACEQVTTGTSSTAFSPAAPVSRGQLATFLWRYAGEPTGYSHGFSDVVSGSYYEEPVAWMASNGITTGTSDTTFSPAATVTRGQLATFLWRYAGEPIGYGHSFEDVLSGTYYEQAVAWMASTGVTTGTSPTEFSPNAPLTRAQAVTFLYRYAQLD